MTTARARFLISLVSLMLGGVVALCPTPAAAQQDMTPDTAQDTTQDLDCTAAQQAIVAGQMTAPPGMTKADFEYCVGWPFEDTARSTRMRVRPRTMATATRTVQAGEFPLDSLDNYLVYVPAQCVGTKRCPLVVFLHWGLADASETLLWQRPVADKYGMIVLAPTAPGRGWTARNEPTNRKNVDAAIAQVLRKFAVDPNKIALVGHCQSGSTAMIWGSHNSDIFSRIVALNMGYHPLGGMDPPNARNEFYVESGFAESADDFKTARELEQAGRRVKLVVGLRTHAPQAEGFDFLGWWLQESWAHPTAAARTAPRVVANQVPVVTPEMLTKMTAFWTRFQSEPDSIRTTARQDHQREVVLPIGPTHATTVMVDMPTLAATYPSVAAALKAAGLTAQQHEAYRIALFSTIVAARLRSDGGTVEMTDGLAQNLAFLETHPEEFHMLDATEIWQTP